MGPPLWRRPIAAGQPPAELWGASKLLSPAKAAALQAPSLRVLADTTQQGVRTLRVRIHSERGADTVGLRVDGDTATVRSLTVEGRSITADPAGFVFHAPGPAGVEAVADRYKAPGGKIRLRVTDVTGIPGRCPHFRASSPTGLAVPRRHQNLRHQGLRPLTLEHGRSGRSGI